MSAEAGRITDTDVRTRWEGQVINGVFPLRRFLGGSDHGAVFLSECKVRSLPDVAIKLVPADAQAPTQLALWRTAATLSHPHLIRLFDTGECQVGGRDYLFVVMEYAEQTLAQVLSRRALSPDEARELLLPTIDALSFLHRNQLVHSRLKPSNVLAVDDRLKLSSDAVRPSGSVVSRVGGGGLPYPPPELKDRGISPAADIWSLGTTLVEALTQRTPAWPDERRETVSLPASLPAPFADTVRRCLSVVPANRPTIADLEAQYKPAPQARSTSDQQSSAREPSHEASASQRWPKHRLASMAFAAVLLTSLAVWVGLHFSATSRTHLQSPAASASVPADVAKVSASSSVARPTSNLAVPPATTSLAALVEAKPDVPPNISDKIKGRIIVTVRVLVDPAGDVIAALIDNPGPSKYFAHRANDAAKEWKFAPAADKDARVWVLTFAFTRGGVTAQATAVQ